MTRRFLPACVALLLGVLAAGQSAAQPTSGFDLVLRGVPLPDALETLVRTTRIDLVYNTELVQPVPVHCVRRNANVEQLLECVLADTGLEFVRSASGAYLLIPAVREKAVQGSIAGAIVDAETGAPLPYANVLLADAGTGTSANEAGHFAIGPIISGPHRMLVTYVGYETADDSIYVEPGGRHRVQIALRSSRVTMKPVVVDGLEQRLPSRGLGEENANGAELRAAMAMGAADVARIASSIGGVSVQRPLADLHIQGGSAGAHVVLLDGAPVRDPVSLGRHLSAFSPLALGRMTVSRAGFGVAEGSNLTGFLRLDHDLSVEARQSMQVSVDPLSVNARLAARTADASRVQGSVMIAGRTSIWGIHREQYVDELFERWHAPEPLFTSLWLGESVTPESVSRLARRPNVQFSDVHAAARLRPSSFHSFDASAYRARNRLGAEIAASNESASGSRVLFATNDLYDWENWAAQLRHAWLPGSRTLVVSQIRGSWHDSRYTYGASEGSYSGNGGTRAERIDQLITEAGARIVSDEANRIDEYSVSTSLEQSLHRYSSLTVGIEMSRVEARFRLANPFVDPLDYAQSTWHGSGYAAGELRFGVRNVIEPGLRATYVPARKETYLEPRISIRHDRESSLVGGVAVRVAAGLYRQFINEFELSSSGSTVIVPFLYFWLPADASVAPPRAHHFTGDVLILPDERWALSLSAFYKGQPRVLMLDYLSLVEGNVAHPVQQSFTTVSSGQTWGLETRVAYRSGRLSVSGGHAFTHAERRIPGRFGDRSVPVPWVAPNTLHGRIEVQIPGRTVVEGGARYEQGRHWPYRRGYYDYALSHPELAQILPPDLDRPGSGRLPSHLMIDVGFRREIGLPTGGKIRFGAFILNLLDREAVFERNLYAAGESGFSTADRTLPGRSAMVSVTISP